MWRIFSGERIKTFRVHSASVNSVVFSPNGEYLACGSGDRTISMLSVSSGRQVRWLFGHSACVKSVVFSLNGEYLASGSRDCTVGVWKFLIKDWFDIY